MVSPIEPLILILSRKRDDKKRWVSFLLLLIVVGFIFLTGCISPSVPVDTFPNPGENQNITVIDSTNSSYNFIKPVERIVALNLDTIETLIVIGAGEKSGRST